MRRFPPRRIVVPLDAFELSLAAWRFAVELARPSGATPDAVYVEDVPLFVPELYVPPPREVLEEAKARIRAVIGKAAPLRVLRGDAAEEIVRYAKQTRADLIVMGTHGRKGVRLFLMGSVAERVAHLTRTPVLTLREEPRAIRAILAPVDFTPYSDAGFRYAAALAAAWKARLTALHVTSGADSSAEAQERIERMIHVLPADIRKACSPSVRIAHGDPIPGILGEARRHQLVVLVAHRKYLLSDLVLGTTAERVLRHCRVPVLSLPSGDGGRATPRTAQRRAGELAAA